jgi:hypothetical protein
LGQLYLREFLLEVLCAVLTVELRSVWSWLLLVENICPVDAGEPRMSHDLLSVTGSRPESGCWILVKKLRAKVPGIITQEWEVQSGGGILDVFEQLLLILIVEWRLSAKHLIYDTSKRPPV